MKVCHTPDIFESAIAQRLRQFVREQVQAWKTGTPIWTYLNSLRFLV